MLSSISKNHDIPPQRGEITCSCKGTLTISGSLIFWQVSSKNEVVQAVEIGWKAVIAFGVVPHLHTLRNQNNLEDKLLLITFWVVLLALMNHCMVVM